MSEQKNNWNVHAEHLDKQQFIQKQTNEVIERLHAQPWWSPSLQVLDFGCGSGKFARQLVQRGVEQVHCADVERTLLDFAEQKAAEEGCQDRLTFQYLEKLDGSELAVGQYDCAVAMTVFGHVRDKDAAIVFANVVKALKVGGHVVISEFKNFDHSFFHDEQLFKSDHPPSTIDPHRAHEHVSDGGHHHTQFNEEVWRRLAQDNNLEIQVLEEYFHDKLNFFIAKRVQ